MEQHIKQDAINPKAFVITVGILLLIPIVYVLFIKSPEVTAPEPVVQTAPVVNNAPTAQTPVEATPAQPAAPTTPQIETLKKAIATDPSESNYLNLGMAYYYNKQYTECVAASRKVIAINPNNALAYNNICSAYNNLGQWDSAIAAGQAALRLNPDFQLARNNVNWAMEMKAKGQ